METEMRSDKELVIRPDRIEAKSMKIIEEELEMRGISIPPENAPVVRRVIHTTADFDYAINLVFSPGAVEKGIAALLQKKHLVTDTNMAKAGISAPGLKRLDSQAVCYMADPAVAFEAGKAGTTRAAVSMDHAVRHNPDAVYVIGNAPTALFSLADQIREGRARPSLVIGVPVGFVNVVEAKEEMIRCCGHYGIPYIVARGRKGGSTVAAAICNALIYEAAGMTDPRKRL